MPFWRMHLDQLRVSHLTEQITLVSLNNSACATNVYPMRCIMTSIDILFISINPKSGSVSIFRTNLLQTTFDSKRNFRFFKLCSRNSNVSVSNILKRFYRDDFSLSISAPQKITRTSLPLSFQSPWDSRFSFIPKWSFLTRLSPVRSAACAFRARLWKQRHLGSGTGCILNRIQFIDVDGALTCSCHVLGSEAASSSVHSVECTSLARVSNILHALLPLHSRNNFCRARVLPVSFRTRNARN